MAAEQIGINTDIFGLSTFLNNSLLSAPFDETLLRFQEISASTFNTQVRGFIRPEEEYVPAEDEYTYPIDGIHPDSIAGSLIIGSNEPISSEFKVFVDAIRPALILRLENESLRERLSVREKEGDLLRSVFQTTNIGLQFFRIEGEEWSNIFYNPGIANILGFDFEDPQDRKLLDDLLSSREGLLKLISQDEVDTVSQRMDERVQDESGIIHPPHIYHIKPRGDQSQKTRSILSQTVFVESNPGFENSEKTLLISTLDITNLMEMFKVNETLKYFYQMVLHNMGNTYSILNTNLYVASKAEGERKIQAQAMVQECGEEISRLLTELSSITSMIKTSDEADDRNERCLPSIELQSAINSSKIKIKQNEIAVEDHSDPYEQSVVTMPPVFLRLVFKELVTNLVKYKSQSNSRMILITDKSREGFIGIIIGDNGLPISDEENQKIFERNYRGKNSKSAYGTGNGLHLARELVRSQGGSLEYEEQLEEKEEGDPEIIKLFKVYIPIAA